MNKIYLVCTRSAITASALTYIINNSPDCYNLSHNNLWLYEESECFGTAHIINDWWNVSDYLKQNGYDADFRNTEELDADQLIKLCSTWQEMNTGKDICLFTHARNTKQIIEYRNELNLPIVVLTTYMGNDCHNFIEGILRREYNPEMNTYAGLLKSWDHIYNQITTQDAFWTNHSDISLKMSDWLLNSAAVYSRLGLAAQANMQLWCNQFLLFNNMLEEFEDYHVIYDDTDIYKIQLYVYLFNKYRDHLTDYQQQHFAAALPVQHNSEPRYSDIREFSIETLKKAKVPVDIINKIV